MKRPSIYLDHNATTPLAASVKESIPRWAESFGNPSSIHWAGRPSKLILREARQTLAKLLNCDPLELIFTSGGSESNNAVLNGIFDSIESGWSWAGAHKASDRRELIISAIEHPSVIKAAEFLSRKGFRVHIVPVEAEKGLDMEFYKKVLSEKTALVSMMLANNETGMIFPTQELCRLAHEAGALFHCDAVQGLGKMEFDLKSLNVDFASFSGHKFYALKGTGVLFVKRGANMESFIHGGGQERGRRAGTENILGIASLGEMAKKKNEIAAHVKQMENLRVYMEESVRRNIDGVCVISKNLPRLSNTSCLLVSGVDGETLLMNLDVQGFGVSTGAACSSGNPEPSPVLLALGLTRAQAQSSMRVSLGWGTTKEEIDLFMEALKQVVIRLRSFEPEMGVVNV